MKEQLDSWGSGEFGDFQCFAERVKVGKRGIPEPLHDEAERFARELVQHDAPVSREQVEEAIKSFPWPRQSQLRQVQREGEGNLVSFGAYTHGGCHGITRVSRRRPALAQLLNKYVHQVQALWDLEAQQSQGPPLYLDPRN